MVHCKNCGGTFDETAVKCPYCGTMHFAGAAAAYNQKIETITDDLKDLGDLPAQAYKDAVVTQGKHISKILLTTVIVVALIAGLVFAVFILPGLLTENYDAEIARQQVIWSQTVYPELDALYEAGDFDAILAFETDLYSDNDNIYSLFSWSHYNFLESYRTHTEVVEAQARFATDLAYSEFDLGYILYFALGAYQDTSFEGYTETDLIYLTEYYQSASDFLQENFDFTEDDLAQLYQTFTADDGWVGLNETMAYMEAFI